MRVVDVEGVMADNSLVNFLSDPATLVSLGVIAAGTAYYLSTRPTPVKPPIPLDNQSIELPVSSSLSLEVEGERSGEIQILIAFYSIRV